VKKHVVIVGGGISGLSAAFDLDQAGIGYTLVERDNRLGGVILTNSVEGCTLEAGPDSFISQKPAALQLIRELGLADQVIGSNDHLRATFIRKNGNLIPMPDGLMMMIPTKAWPMAKSPLLSWGTKIRMGLEYFRKPAAEPLPDRSVSEFIGDHFGQETVDYLAEPLLAGVFGGDPRRLSALSTLPRFVEMERKYGSLSKAALSAPAPPAPSPGAGPTSLFRTMKGGLTSLVEALRPKQTVLLGAPVEALEGNADGFRVRRNGDWIQATDVILTGPSYEAGRLLEGRLGEIQQGTEYSSSATVTLGFRKAELGRELKGFGILVPGVERKRMRACTFVANKFSHRVAEGFEVIRCFLGGTADEGVLEESDERILEIVREELRELLAISAPVAFYRVQRWRKSMAQYTVGHQKRVKQMMSLCDQIPGLHLAGNGYQGIGLPDCIEMGRAAARRVAVRQ
jgi:protoporphyrinogen/coproporphyrinogen III oxidase